MELDNKKCGLSENGRCMHYCSEGELKCNGTESEKDNCMEYNEVGN